tara:strand:- start:688 stop:993 length:306 start_codon:yes stop_codon:yes gene_type:complete
MLGKNMKYLINLVIKEKGLSEVIDSDLPTIHGYGQDVVMKDKAKAIEKAKKLYINYLIKALEENNGRELFKAIKVVPIYSTVIENTDCEVVDYSNYLYKKA